MRFPLNACALLGGGLSLAALIAFPTSPVMAQGVVVEQSSASTVGYIDSAIPSNVFRLRAEAAYDLNRSDRALFIYPQGFDPRIDYQDIAPYLEVAFGQQFSGFVELHQHWVNPQEAPNAEGFGDMNTGFKWAFLKEEDRVATFQLKTYLPTGEPNLILGTGHASLEPGLLLYQRLTDRLTFEGELRDWIPLTSDDFAGNVLRYGAGFSYRAFEAEHLRVSPVAELVGWTVLGGKESVSPDVIESAAGDTIVNLKVGARCWFGEHSDLYLGYGRALTGDVWYKDIIRLEYRFAF